MLYAAILPPGLYLPSMAYEMLFQADTQSDHGQFQTQTGRTRGLMVSERESWALADEHTDRV
jgi:hypothetical protein